MFVNGVKVTVTICLTIIVSCVLFISYSEYTNRYTIVSTPDNSIYIFDKKSTTLNRCNEKGCEFLETKIPMKSSGGITNQIMQAPSKMFGENNPMTEEIVKVEATPKEEQNTEKDIEEKDEQIQKEKKQEKNGSKKIQRKQNNESKPNTNKPITVKK